MMHPPGIERMAERAHHMFLAYQFGKAFGPPLAGEDEIGHAPILPRRLHLRLSRARVPG